MSDDIILERIIERDARSAACGIAVETADIVRWFGRRNRIPVVATINGYVWRSSLSPMGGRHLIAINADVRKGAGVGGGDRVTIALREDTAERTIDVPADLAAALGAAESRAAFDAMAFTHRKEWVRALEDAKRPETRLKRIADCVAAMQARRSGTRLV